MTTEKQIENLIRKLNWYAKFFEATSISNTASQEEIRERAIKSETYFEIIEIIKHDLAIKNGKRSA